MPWELNLYEVVTDPNVPAPPWSINCPTWSGNFTKLSRYRSP